MAKKSGGRGVFAKVFTGFWILIIIGGIFGWAKANDIHSFGDVWNYAQVKSDKANKCYGDEPLKKTWECGPLRGGGKDGDSGSKKITLPSKPTKISKNNLTTLSTKLDKLPTKAVKKVDYDRGEWKHWSQVKGSKCNTREVIVIDSGKNVKTDPKNKCRAVSGKWVSPFDNKKFTDASKMDLDHVIPLGYAATHGGNSWSKAKKEKYANDFGHLLLVSAHSNRSKGAKGPGSYMPPNKNYWCSYSEIWIKTTSKYKLWVGSKDKAKMKEGLSKC